jgi:uncharacterized spore protein YtfJ
MKHVEEILESLSGQLRTLAQGNAVVAKPLSVGDKHVIPLCQLSMGLGAGGGIGEGEADDAAGYAGGKGVGGGAGGGAKVAPVAVVVVDGDEVRIETFEV